MNEPLRVAIVGCGLIGRKRAEALGEDQLIGCFDTNAIAAEALAQEYNGAKANGSLEDLIGLEPDVVIVATTHNRLAEITVAALEARSNVLVEKPAGMSSADVSQIRDVAERSGSRVKVGFNHRFHPGIARAVSEARSGDHGEVMFARARYGHGGRIGYENEWRADPAIAGGGELTDQGMHLLDIFYWLLGPLPLHSSLLRTHFWAMPVEDNAVFTVAGEGPGSPWATAHVTWTEWKNMFSLEIYCRAAKLQVDGLAGSYGPQRLRIYRMKPEMGPPEAEEIIYPEGDPSWGAEWRHFREALAAEQPLLGDLESASYAWRCVEAAYAAAGIGDS